MSPMSEPARRLSPEMSETADPASLWNTSSPVEGTAGLGTRRVKIAGGHYAMIYSVAVRECFFDFYYVGPYGNVTWSDTERPVPPAIQPVVPGAGSGTLDV
jgi:hypothetical protein